MSASARVALSLKAHRGGSHGRLGAMGPRRPPPGSPSPDDATPRRRYRTKAPGHRGVQPGLRELARAAQGAQRLASGFFRKF